MRKLNMEKLKMASFLLTIAVGCVMMQTTSALIHVVGGDMGWTTPTTDKDLYVHWAAPRRFGVGDELMFPFRPQLHTVVQVNKQDFDACGHDHVIHEWIGPARVPLPTPGDYFFFCGVGTHCMMGQKLHVVVGTAPGSDGIDWAAKIHAGRKLLPGGTQNNVTRPVVLV